MRLARVVVVALAVAAIVGQALPGRANAAIAWSDPAGDATGIDPFPPPAPNPLVSTPRPSDPEIDLLELSMAADADALTFRATTTADGYPVGATGATVRFVFEYEGTGYQLIAQRTAPDFATAITSGVFFRAREPRSPELSCRECRVRYDPKTQAVTVTAALTSLAAGIKAHDASAAEFGPGSEITGLMVIGQRNVLPLERSVDVGRTLTVDIAAAGAVTVVV